MMEILPQTMAAVLLTGHGGYEKLVYSETVPMPIPDVGEVLIRVAAAGVNNTDINTRIAWYSKRVTAETNKGGGEGFADADDEDGSWSGVPMDFPRIQGADVCGYIVAVGDGVSEGRIGERVLVRNMLRTYVDYRPFECWTIGSECDGGFAQFTKAPSRETYGINCDWSDEELASVPCAYSTAEGMLHRAGVGAETVLVTGASGGVGSAAVQLAKVRGARVIAVASAAKMEAVEKLGADLVIDRSKNLVDELGPRSLDIVVDLVAGPQWGQLLELLRRGGRYTVAGAIAGPIVEFDVRTLYLNDLSFFGCTFQDDGVFENVISNIEHGQVRPFVSKTYPLQEIVAAQTDFIAKKYPGKLVLIPPSI
jgi:NADPH:quinone reductase-like Zn-dependent oxidoreductase